MTKTEKANCPLYYRVMKLTNHRKQAKVLYGNEEKDTGRASN